jgi:hypothetical protein
MIEDEHAAEIFTKYFPKQEEKDHSVRLVISTPFRRSRSTGNFIKKDPKFYTKCCSKNTLDILKEKMPEGVIKRIVY